MKFIVGIFCVGILVVVYNYFEESNEPPRNLIKGIVEILIVIFLVFFFVNRYFLLFR